LKVGLLFAAGGADAEGYDRALDEVRRAEQRGFSSVWLLDERGAPPFALSAAVAAETRALRIAVVTAPAARHPLRLAEDGAVLDLLSGGRLIFAADPGAGAGEPRGRGSDQHWERFCEGLDIVVKAWSHEAFAYLGKVHRIPLRTRAQSSASPCVPEPYCPPYVLPWQRAGLPFDYLSVLPKPTQIPRPPVFVVARDARAVTFAARKGFSLFLGVEEAAGGLRDKAALYWRELASAGREREEVVLALAREVYVEADGESARRRIPGASARALVGSPDEIFRTIKTVQQETGVGHLACALRVPGLSSDQTLGSLDLFASAVATRLEM
jgi:alkanesulfonate monooxygenase SsuD/methylene tetrahydromethanopterin reductase-like flavin-dependent oxidoreductase (luciferase family)